jgi:4-hydroxyacetophenone monooxygenase
VTESLTDVRAETVVDDLYWREEYSPIVEDDAFLRRIVETSDLPALMVALAAATGDYALLRTDLRPPQPLPDLIGVPHGGMTPEAQAEARELAFDALKRVRDEAITGVGTLTEAQAHTVIEWLTNAANPEYHEMLMHDMALVPEAGGRPKWNFGQVARDRGFSVAVIGSGVAGMGAAYRLQQAGIPYTVFEKGHDVGGTW